jgi:hypothetical protein
MAAKAKATQMNDRQRGVRRMIIYAAIVGLAFWLSPRHHSAPKAAAPAPAMAVQTTPMAPDDPWADVG